MIARQLSNKIIEAAQGFPLVALLGPRQSGKTTLAKMAFPDYQYISLENHDHRQFADQDPRGFLSTYHNQVIFDEIQRVPALFSYLQEVVDTANRPGQYILTGSHHFLLMEKVTQSLAGRIALFTLLPLSFQELKATKKLPQDYKSLLYQGTYPRIYNHTINPSDWYANYLATYVERDVRLMINIKELSAFQRLLTLCAGRCGQLLNYSELASDCGVEVNTVKAWLSILEASFIIYLLRPHHKNFNKRVIKSPKLYFYDTGLACSLLGIQNPTDLNTHFLRRGLFENLMIIELLKQCLNQGLRPNLYFWRDKTGHEIDCLLEHVDHMQAIEIKSGQTYQSYFLKGLQYYQKLAGADTELFLIYGGSQNMVRNGVNVHTWQKTAFNTSVR